MKKLLLLLFLIPNLVMGETKDVDRFGFPLLIAAGPSKQPTFDVKAAKADGLSDEEIQKLIAEGPPKKEVDCGNLTKEQRKGAFCGEYYKRKRWECASSSHNAKSDFAAKKIYETCLDALGVPKK